MNSEFSSQIAIIDGSSSRKEKIMKGIIAIFFIGSFIGNTVTIALGVAMLKHCYNVALIVMVIGSVLGYIQQVPEFFRNFIVLERTTARYVNYIFVFTIVTRIAWLISATVVIAKAECNNITPAWICIYINWATFASIVTIISIVVIMKFLKGRS